MLLEVQNAIEMDSNTIIQMISTNIIIANHKIMNRKCIQMTRLFIRVPMIIIKQSSHLKYIHNKNNPTKDKSTNLTKINLLIQTRQAAANMPKKDKNTIIMRKKDEFTSLSLFMKPEKVAFVLSLKLH